MSTNRLINPFTNDLTIPFIQIVKGYKTIEGEIKPDSYNVEAEEYVRVYTSAKKRQFLFTNLTMYARDMMMAIEYMLNREYQYVILSYEKIQELYGDSKYGRRRYDDTIRELYKYFIIDHKDKVANEYWYNPRYFAAGNRLEIYPECILKVKTINKTLQYESLDSYSK